MKIAPLLLLVTSTTAMAGGFVTQAIPTQLDIVRDEGFMIVGPFGNPGGCTISNRFFVKSDHPQYKQIYATALAAYVGKFKITAYVHNCAEILWYTASPSTYNIVYSYSSLAITD